MSSAATGSLGALLMIAPLAAIPVFAIVGVPTIGSMAAAPADELDVSDVEPIEDRPRMNEDGRRRTASTDLFESYDTQPGRRSRERGTAQSDGVGARPKLKRGRVDESLGATESDSIPGQFDDSLREEARTPEKSPRREFDPRLLLNNSGRNRLSGEGDVLPTRTARSEEQFGEPQSPRVLSEESDRWLKARERIREYQITWHQLSPEEDRDGNLVFVFTCFMTPAGEPSHRYHAAGKSPLEAVEATLRKIDEFRREFQ